MKSLNSEMPAKDDLTASQFFDRAFAYYGKVSSSYLDQPIQVVGSSSSDELIAARKYLFIYPDLRLSFHPDEPRTFYYFSFSDVYLEYLVNHLFIDSLYSGTEELNDIIGWLGEYHAKNFAPNGFLARRVRYEVLQKLDQVLQKRNIPQNLDFNLLYLYLGRGAQEKGDSAAMLRYFGKVQRDKLFNILQSKEYAGQINDQSFRLIAFAIEGLYQSGMSESAYGLIKMFKNPINQSSLYAFVAEELQKQHQTGNLVNALIDSAKSQMMLAEHITEGQPNRQLLAPAMILQSPAQNATEALRLIKNISGKPDAVRNMCRFYAFRGDLFRAVTNISPLISNSDLASYYLYILYGYTESNDKSGKQWAEYDRSYLPHQDYFIRYIDENS